MISIGALTDALVSVLAGSGVLIGDGVAPLEAGWSSGTPNTGQFVPYSVVGFNGASVANPDVGRGDPEWSTQWGLRHYGGSREQADWVADRVRLAALSALRTDFGVLDVFRVAAVQWSSLGALQRNDTVDPPYWQSSDGLILLASRVRIGRD